MLLSVHQRSVACAQSFHYNMKLAALGRGGLLAPMEEVAAEMEARQVIFHVMCACFVVWCGHVHSPQGSFRGASAQEQRTGQAWRTWQLLGTGACCPVQQSHGGMQAALLQRGLAVRRAACRCKVCRLAYSAARQKRVLSPCGSCLA